MILKYTMIALVILALFPQGRALLSSLFAVFTGIFSSHDDADDTGPHYDHFTGELHAYREPGGMYDKDNQ